MRRLRLLTEYGTIPGLTTALRRKLTSKPHEAIGDGMPQMLAILFAFLFSLLAHANAFLESRYYDQLFADGRFDIALFLGFEQVELFPVLQDTSALEGSIFALEAEILACSSCHFRSVKRGPGFHLFETVFEYRSRQIQTKLLLVYPSPQVDLAWLKRRFIHSLQFDDLIMYAGHGRNGEGFPDFASPLSNTGKVFFKDPFAGWKGFDKGYFAGDKFQILSLNSCRSRKHFLSPLRHLIWEKDPSKLALLLTNDETLFWDYPLTSIALIQGLMAHLPRKELLSKLEAAAQNYHRENRQLLFHPDGFFDQTYQSTPKPRRAVPHEPYRNMPF